LSIITINLNNVQGLLGTIESVIIQGLIDVEFIIVDGGSTDGSLDIIKQYSHKLTHWISEPDKGIYNAMNKGLLLATGKYCLFLNSGDKLTSDSILKEAESLLSGEDIIYGDGIIEDSEGRFRRFPVPETLSFDYFYFNSLIHQSSFIKRELFDKYGMYNEANTIVSDWEFFLKTIIVNNVRTKHIPLDISIVEDKGISRIPENREVIINECNTALSRYFPQAVINLLADHKSIKSDLKWIRKMPFIDSVLP
jgi:glycosyltransferase involved in cell wall biosynthesis